MKEIEVKILEVNRLRIEERLVTFGAKKIFDGDIRTVFFDFPDRRIVKEKDVLRLRTEKEKTELTYKKVHTTQTVKEAEETSTNVSSEEATRKILENIGLIQIENMLKHRISYRLNNVRFDIDRYLEDYKFIPEFMEIEAENKDLISKYAELLGFKSRDCLSWSTNELIEYYSQKRQRTKIGEKLEI